MKNRKAINGYVFFPDFACPCNYIMFKIHARTELFEL